jgi:hypothetical protein
MAFRMSTFSTDKADKGRGLDCHDLAAAQEGEASKHAAINWQGRRPKRKKVAGGPKNRSRRKRLALAQ